MSAAPEDQAHQIRLVLIDGDPWFVAYDVSRALGFNLMNGMWAVDVQDRIKLLYHYLGAGKGALRINGGEAIWFVSECGLHNLLPGRTHRAFRRWVITEVLPAVRASDLTTMASVDLPVRRGGYVKVKTGQEAEAQRTARPLPVLRC